MAEVAGLRLLQRLLWKKPTTLDGTSAEMTALTNFADLDTQLWHLIQSLPRVGRFIGEQNKPTPLSEADINKILEKIKNPAAPKPKIFFENGEVVRIVDGPFANFTATVEEYDIEQRKLKLNVSIFNRNTLVEIPYSQVEKII